MVALSFLCVGGNIVLFAATAIEIFGIKNGGQIFSLIGLACPLSSIAGTVLVKAGMSPFWICNIGGLLTLCNFCLLYYFDCTAMLPKGAKSKKLH